MDFPNYTGRDKGADLHSLSLRSASTMALSPQPAPSSAGCSLEAQHLRWHWGDSKGSFVLEQRQLVQVGGGDGEALVSSERKCYCRQGECREVILPSADMAWWGCQLACHSGETTYFRPFQTATNSSPRAISKLSP